MMHSIRPNTLRLLILLVAITGTTAAAQEITATRIWDKGGHNAFTDLVRWRGKFYCTFREGERHVHGADGKVRVIASDDGNAWKTVALIAEPGVDLRDGKLSVTPDDRLMILMGGSYYKDRVIQKRLSRVAFINSPSDFVRTSEPVKMDERIKTNNDWLWRVTWHKGVGYGTMYQAYYPPGAKRGALTTDEHPWGFHLVKTTDGVNYERVQSFDLGTAGEAAMEFIDGDKMVIVTRRGPESDVGVSSAPYTEWEWNKFDLALGGPDLIRLPDGKLILGTRWFHPNDNKVRSTVFGTLTLDGKFEKKVEVPSGGDTSYPGMLLHDGNLWATYYSSHEKKTSVYLSKIPLSKF